MHDMRPCRGPSAAPLLRPRAATCALLLASRSLLQAKSAAGTPNSPSRPCSKSLLASGAWGHAAVTSAAGAGNPRGVCGGRGSEYPWAYCRHVRRGDPCSLPRSNAAPAELGAEPPGLGPRHTPLRAASTLEPSVAGVCPPAAAGAWPADTGLPGALPTFTCIDTADGEGRCAEGCAAVCASAWPGGGDTTSATGSDATSATGGDTTSATGGSAARHVQVPLTHMQRRRVGGAEGPRAAASP